jgi:hypothetical protein
MANKGSTGAVVGAFSVFQAGGRRPVTLVVELKHSQTLKPKASETPR